MFFTKSEKKIFKNLSFNLECSKISHFRFIFILLNTTLIISEKFLGIEEDLKDYGRVILFKGNKEENFDGGGGRVDALGHFSCKEVGQ